MSAPFYYFGLVSTVAGMGTGLWIALKPVAARVFFNTQGRNPGSDRLLENESKTRIFGIVLALGSLFSAVMTLKEVSKI